MFLVLQISLMAYVVWIGPLMQNICDPEPVSYHPKWVLVELVALLGLATSFSFDEPGTIPALLILPWCLIVLIRFVRFVLRDIFQNGVTSILRTAAYFYLFLGAFGLLSARGQGTVFNFGEPIATLFAIHFHYAAVLPLLFLSCIFEGTKMNMAKLFLSLGLVFGAPLVAIGFFVTVQFKFFAVIFFTMVLLWLSIEQWRFAVRNPDTTTRQLLKLSAAALWISMPLAILYAWGEMYPGAGPDMAFMAMSHGIINVLFFGFPALIALARHKNTKLERPVVLYDGGCGICVSYTKLMRRFDVTRALSDLSIEHDGLFAKYPGLSRDAVREVTHVGFASGELIRAHEAVHFVTLVMPTTRLVGLILSFPPFLWLAGKVYPLVARNRHKISKACERK